MNEIGHNVVEQPLVMGDDEQRTPAVAKSVDPFGHHFQGVDVKPRIGFVQNRQLRL